MNAIVIRIISISSLNFIGKRHIDLRINTQILFEKVLLVHILKHKVHRVVLGFLVKFKGIKVVTVYEGFILQ